MRPTWADVDLSAIAHNAKALMTMAEPAELCAVVKADAYGHGAVPVARAAVDAGAPWLGVALVEEGRRLREAGIAAPILLLSEPRPKEMIEVAELGLCPTVYSGEGLAAAAAAAAQVGVDLPVHLKVDTGMHRVGAHPSDAAWMAQAIVDKPSLELQGVWTHCAVADELDNPFTAHQLDVFDRVVDELAGVGIRPRYCHAANSAVTLGHPRGRYDIVRCGICLYGVTPSTSMVHGLGLQPAMSLRSEVSMVKRVPAGSRISYGHRYEATRETVIATVPIGYADGVRRSLHAVGGEVLVGGRRHPIAGVVTMDQLMLDCGPDADVAPGDEVVLMGCQGDERILAEEIATRLDTIGYEVVCDIGGRVPRRYR